MIIGSILISSHYFIPISIRCALFDFFEPIVEILRLAESEFFGYFVDPP